jgi:hypothetical protein
MKRNCLLGNILVFLLVFLVSVNIVSAKTLYDNFSNDYLDPEKWKQGEFVREVFQGKLVMILHNSPFEESIRKRTSFVDPGPIVAIECDIMLKEAALDPGENSESFARVAGRFYNAQNSGTEKGDIWAAISFGDRGNGLEAWWAISEATDDNGNNWENKGSGSLNHPGLLYNQPYTVKIDYDGAREFSFTVADESDVFTGPVRRGAEHTRYKALETIVYTEGGTGEGFVSASFDNVFTNASAYDDFSTAPLDQANWEEQESAREIKNGKVRLVSHSRGDKETTRLYFSNISPYIEATVNIKSVSKIDSGDRGIARIDGYFYNDAHGPGSGFDYNGYQGNVWVGFYLNYYGDGTLTAACSGDRSLDAADTQRNHLFYREFNLPIVLDRDYQLSIQFTGRWLFFIIKDTVTGRMDVFSYEISTSVYEPYDKDISFCSRLYGNSTGGHMTVELDDVYTDVAEPAPTFDATGDWKLTASNPWAESGCERPDVRDTTNVTITQNGNDFTLVVPDEDEGDMALNGNVYGDTYTFKVAEENSGETEIIYGVFTSSQKTSGTGSAVFIWTDGQEWCESGFEIAFTKPSTNNGGGGGGDSCFIETMNHQCRSKWIPTGMPVVFW